jgi:hypothetical protein
MSDRNRDNLLVSESPKHAQEIIADYLSKGGWSWGCVSAIDSNGRTTWIADAHRDDGKRFVVRADEKLTADRVLGTGIGDSHLRRIGLTRCRVFFKLGAAWNRGQGRLSICIGDCDQKTPCSIYRIPDHTIANLCRLEAPFLIPRRLLSRKRQQTSPHRWYDKIPLTRHADFIVRDIVTGE